MHLLVKGEPTSLSLSSINCDRAGSEPRLEVLLANPVRAASPKPASG
jgi:hypothetical protein